MSTANDDGGDNFFDDPTILRFQTVVEDEPALFKLVSDSDDVLVAQNQKQKKVDLVTAKQGIMCGGNIILDYYKIIPEYPQRNSIVSILQETSGSGGCAYNVISALAIMDIGLPLFLAGALGEDAPG